MTNQGGSSRVPIPHNETPDMHVLYFFLFLLTARYIWDRIISRASASNLFILAYGQGGMRAKNLLQLREQEVLRRLRALALTESTHSLQSELNFGLGSSDSKGLREFLELHSINWLASSIIPASQRVTVTAHHATHT